MARAAGAEEAPADLIELAVLRGPYGVRGWVHVQPHSGDGAVLRSTHRWWLLGPGAARPLAVTGVRAQGGGLVAKWSGCEDPETGQALRGRGIGVSRADFPPLPDGEYYWVDLIGAQVVNRDGLCLGTVRGLRSNGAHDVLEVEPPGAAAGAAGVVLIPMVGGYVDSVDLAARRIGVDWGADW